MQLTYAPNVTVCTIGANNLLNSIYARENFREFKKNAPLCKKQFSVCVSCTTCLFTLINNVTVDGPRRHTFFCFCFTYWFSCF